MKRKDRPFRLDDGKTGMLSEWGEKGPVILCVHGMTSSRRGWERLAGILSDTHRVYAYDQRGHGDLSGVPGPMTLEQSIRDLETAARAIGGPVDILLGHSWGGAVVLLGGPKISAGSVVALDPMIRVRPGSFVPDYVDDLRGLMVLEGEGRVRGIQSLYSGLDPEDLEGKLHAMKGMTIQTLERIGSENGVESGRWDLRGLLEDYPLPLLVMVAGEDSVIDKDDRLWLEGRGSRIRVRTIIGAGHSLHRSHLGAVIEEVMTFQRSVEFLRRG